MRHPLNPRRIGTRGAQRGGFILGLVVGLLIGLAVSLAVALYVTKVPVPFINKVPQRGADQDAAQAEKNRNWDPNGPLAGKSAQRAASGVLAPATAPASATGATPAKPASGADSATSKKKDAAASAAAASAPEALTYFVQAGAYARSEDAEQQRANLALMGLAAKVTEREQSGRTMYRVRLGPFEKKEEADAAKEKLTEAGIDSALVRVQR